MPHFFVILLKINLVLILFAAAYYLVLRRLTFYTLNRIFLVFGILFSSIYPFINLTDFFHQQEQINPSVVAFVPKLNQQVNSLVPTQFINSNWQFIGMLFYIGVGIMALRLIVQFISLYQMHQKSKPGAVADFKVRILTEPVSPFSFWQTVYVNPSLHQERELETILAHEQIHVKQWHSLDIILAELSVVFYWFNPGVWLMKKAVKENLEFITDQKILNKGIDRKTYQYSLLDVGNLTPAVAIVNNFNLSDLKKRIKMMNVKRSSKLTLSRYLLITPVLLVTTLAFTVSKKDIKKHLIPIREVFVNQHFINPPISVSEKQSARPEQKKRMAVNNRQAKQSDTSAKITVMIKQLFLGDDSTSNLTEPLKIVSSKMLESRAELGGEPARKLFVFTDTLVHGKITAPQQQLRYMMEYQTENPRRDQMGEVIVRGYAKIRKPVDSISLKNAVYFVNGKKMTAEEFKASVKTGDIKNIDIQKSPKTVTGIHIITRDQ